MVLPFNIIKTTNKILHVKGKVLYNDRKRKIDLKRPIKDLFDDTSMDVHYIMELCLSKEKAIERVKTLTENNVVPVILYFVKEDKKDE